MQARDFGQSPISPIGIGARVAASGAQSIANSTWTGVLWATETTDPRGFHALPDPPGDSRRLTIPAGLGGLYVVSAQVSWATSNVGTRQARIVINSGGNQANGTNIAHAGPFAGQTGGIQVVMSCVYRFVAGDEIIVYVWQNTGGALNTAAGAADHFAIARIGD